MDNTDTLQYEVTKRPRLGWFFQDSLHSTSVTYIVWLMVGLLIALSAYSIWSNSPLASIGPALLVYYVIVIVHVIYRLRSGGKAVALAPDMLFLLFYTMFHLGYITLYAIGQAPYLTDVFWYESSIPIMMLVVNLGLLGFLFGFEIISPRRGKPVLQEPLKIPKWNWGIFAISVLIGALVLHLICLSFVMDLVLYYGYVVIANIGRYSSDRLQIFMWLSNLLAVFGTTIYVVSSALRHGKLFGSKIGLGLILTFVAIYILEGDRGYIVQLLLPTLLIRHYFIKRIKIRYLIVLFLAALGVFIAISLVRTIVFDPIKMLEELKYRKGAAEASWKSPFYEAGYSIRVTNITCQEVPSVEPYWMGQSYISAILHTVPFLEGYMAREGLRGPDHGYHPSQWITWTYKGREASGMGYSIVTEGYLNFGLPGAFLELVIFGVFLRWLTMQFSKRPSAARGFFMLVCMGVTIMSIRNHLHTVTSLYTQAFIVAVFLKYLCGNEPQLETDGD